MALTTDPILIELLGSRDFKIGPSGVSGVFKACVIQAPDEATALALVAAACPDEVGGIPRGSAEVKDQGNGVYFIDVDYSSAVREAAPPDAGKDPGADPNGQPDGGGGNVAGEKPAGAAMDTLVTFTTGGGTRHLTQAKETIASFGDGAAVPIDLVNAIGASKAGVAGLDVPDANGEFSAPQRLAQLQRGFFARLFGMSGRATNEKPFMGFQAGEVLYLGADGSYKPGEGWNISHRFRVSPNEWVELQLGDKTHRFWKEGWHYLDVQYAQKKVFFGPGNTEPAMIQVPVRAFVRRVFNKGDFSIFQMDA